MPGTNYCVSFHPANLRRRDPLFGVVTRAPAGLAVVAIPRIDACLIPRIDARLAVRALRTLARRCATRLEKAPDVGVPSGRFAAGAERGILSREGTATWTVHPPSSTLGGPFEILMWHRFQSTRPRPTDGGSAGTDA
jgi:hypothetical protein